MVNFVFFVTIFLAAHFTWADDGGINLLRDEWWHFKDQYSNLPRIFNEDTNCPAQKFYLDCNVCGCGPDGKPEGCTERGCPKPPQIANFRISEDDECPAGKQFYTKCNTCTCNENGRGAACTRQACPDPSEKSDN